MFALFVRAENCLFLYCSVVDEMMEKIWCAIITALLFIQQYPPSFQRMFWVQIFVEFISSRQERFPSNIHLSPNRRMLSNPRRTCAKMIRAFVLRVVCNILQGVPNYILFNYFRLICLWFTLTMFLRCFSLCFSLQFLCDFQIGVCFLLGLPCWCYPNLHIMSDFPGMFVFFLQIMIYDLCLGDHKKIIRNS